MIYHPELDAAKDGLNVPALPAEGSMVLFAADYEPRLVKVLELHPSSLKQVVVQMWRPRQPRRGRADFSTARFNTRDSTEEPDRRAVSLAQIRATNLHLTDEFVLDSAFRDVVRRLLRKWKGNG